MIAYAKRETYTPLCITPQEYLKRERTAETKSEYYDGVVVAMAGATWEHNRILRNVIGELYAQLKGSACEPVVNDQRVGVPACNRYFYPDVVALCGEPQFEDSELDTLLNPTLLMEVLSESTQGYDRGKKWECYQTLPSLQTYVLVTQESPRIEIYRRQETGWHYEAVTSLEGEVALESIGCVLRLADVYDRISFSVPETPETNGE